MLRALINLVGNLLVFITNVNSFANFCSIFNIALRFGSVIFGLILDSGQEPIPTKQKAAKLATFNGTMFLIS